MAPVRGDRHTGSWGKAHGITLVRDRHANSPSFGAAGVKCGVAAAREGARVRAAPPGGCVHRPQRRTTQGMQFSLTYYYNFLDISLQFVVAV